MRKSETGGRAKGGSEGKVLLSHRQFLKWCGLAVAGAGAAGASRFVTPPKVASAADGTFDNLTVNGTVGIGTPGPVAPLEISVAGNAFTRTHNTTNAIDARYGADSVGGFFSVVTSHPLKFQTNNTERMRVSSTGNVGIGTADPNAKLEVNGSIIGNAGTVYADSIDATNYGGSGDLYLTLFSQQRYVYVMSAGRSGWGTLSYNNNPWGDDIGSGHLGFNMLTDHGTWISGGTKGFQILSQGGEVWIFNFGSGLPNGMFWPSSDPTNPMGPTVKITASTYNGGKGNLLVGGSLGVGVQGPGARLHVGGDTRIDGNLISGIGDLRVILGSQQSAVQLYASGRSGKGTLTYNNTPYGDAVGIGTGHLGFNLETDHGTWTSAAGTRGFQLLSQHGEVLVYNFGSGLPSGQFWPSLDPTQPTGPTVKITASTYSGAKGNLLIGGSVGIGIASPNPAKRLHVAGDVQIDGDLSVSGGVSTTAVYAP